MNAKQQEKSSTHLSGNSAHQEADIAAHIHSHQRHDHMKYGYDEAKLYNVQLADASHPDADTER
ncbi:hypothetical protein D3C81_2215920 [compost metagenome]